MSSPKVFLNGPAGGGKTETIKAVSDLPLVSVLKKIAKTQNEIALDYGRVYLDGHMVYLYAPALGTLVGQDWTGLSGEMDALLYIIDGSVATVGTSHELLDELRVTWSGPIVIGINSTADPEPSDDVYSELAKRYDSCPVYPYNAISRNSVLSLVGLVLSSLNLAEARL